MLFWCGVYTFLTLWSSCLAWLGVLCLFRVASCGHWCDLTRESLCNTPRQPVRRFLGSEEGSPPEGAFGVGRVRLKRVQASPGEWEWNRATGAHFGYTWRIPYFLSSFSGKSQVHHFCKKKLRRARSDQLSYRSHPFSDG